MTIYPDTPNSSRPEPASDTLWRPDAAVTGNYREWLMRHDLVTSDLERSAGGPIAVTVLREGTASAPQWSQDLVGAHTGRGWCREVTLSSENKIFIHAESYTPPATLEQHVWLSQLGTRALGSMLAKQPNCERTYMRFAKGAHVPSSCVPDASWVRRSVFEFDGLPLFLIEWFSDALQAFERGRR